MQKPSHLCFQTSRFAFVADPVLHRHAGILENDLRSGGGIPTELLFRRAEGNARCVLVDYEAGDALGLVIASTKVYLR